MVTVPELEAGVTRKDIPCREFSLCGYLWHWPQRPLAWAHCRPAPPLTDQSQYFHGHGNCSTQSGPGAATTITVKPQTTLAGSATIVVTLPGSITGGFVVTPPAITTLSTTNQAAGIQYSVKAAVGCVGMVNAATPTFAFLANTGSGAVADAPVTVTTTLTSTVSGLSLSSSLVTVNCVFR